jgi:hypothetical protein
MEPYLSTKLNTKILKISMWKTKKVFTLGPMSHATIVLFTLKFVEWS